MVAYKRFFSRSHSEKSTNGKILHFCFLEARTGFGALVVGRQLTFCGGFASNFLNNTNMNTNMKLTTWIETLLTLVCILLSSVDLCDAQEPEVSARQPTAEENEVLDQSAIGPNGCGPCALINSLKASRSKSILDALPGKLGAEKARSFIQKYGNVDSIPYGKARKSYTNENGTTDIDLLAMINTFARDIGSSELAGQYLLREEGQTAEQFLTEFREIVQSSISQGFHPMLSVRGLAAEYDKDREKHVWNSKGGHWIAIHSVGEVSRDQLSVVVDFSDSISGNRQIGLVSFNKHRSANIPMTFTVDKFGNTNWNWVANSQTLEITAPGMPLGTTDAKWNERTFIAVRYLITLKRTK